MYQVQCSKVITFILTLFLCICSQGLFAKDPLKKSNTLEKEFPWNEQRRLTWDDFKGPTPANADNSTAAVTFCGIGFEANTTTNESKAKVTVYNTFYTNQSWVRTDGKSPEILAHEQGHFDICEIYTRKLREEMTNASVTVNNLKSVLQSIYDEVNKEYENRQLAYENETKHGTITVQQQRWSKIIAQELN